MVNNWEGALKGLVQKSKRDFRRNSRKTSKAYGKIAHSLNNKNPTFYVVVQSPLDKDYEQDIEITEQGDLEHILIKARNEFNSINNRTGEYVNNQRTYSVYMVEKDLSIEVPRKIYQKYLRNLGRNGK
tara:strand:+ start:837 stop:1220 length:384 start_codon:yes stop_codon:yes gene_type:complete